jgi:hypothetical protein
MISEWIIQLIWFIAGLFGTGAFWYYLSQHNNEFSFLAGLGAIFFALLAVALHRRNDKSNQQSLTKENEGIVLEIHGEVVRFKELLRSVDYDVVKIEAYTHMYGVMAEHQWFHLRYPNSELIRQELTTSDFITGKRKKKKTVQTHFDILTIKLADGQEKEIYFDISSFFDGSSERRLDPETAKTKKIADLYKEL